MILRKMLFWKTQMSKPTPSFAQQPPAASASAPPKNEVLASVSNVIALPAMGATNEEPLEATADDEFAAPPRQPTRIKGLMNAPELVAFFEQDYVSIGRNNGSRYRSREALETGQQALIAKFQNALVDLSERRQAKHDRLQRQIVDIDGLGESLVAQLRLACEHLEREMSVLRQQVDLAAQRKGWVLDALNRYQLGFDRGLRAALEFELIGV